MLGQNLKPFFDGFKMLTGFPLSLLISLHTHYIVIVNVNVFVNGNDHYKWLIASIASTVNPEVCWLLDENDKRSAYHHAYQPKENDLNKLSRKLYRDRRQRLYII